MTKYLYVEKYVKLFFRMCDVRLNDAKLRCRIFGCRFSVIDPYPKYTIATRILIDLPKRKMNSKKCKISNFFYNTFNLFRREQAYKDAIFISTHKFIGGPQTPVKKF